LPGSYGSLKSWTRKPIKRNGSEDFETGLATHEIIEHEVPTLVAAEVEADLSPER
jgi:hypothetical protein